jgi:hypothetical protein
MKKINVMIYAETLDALCNLPNEDIGQIMKHIKDWNDGKDVVITNPFHKMAWDMILPDLERNKESYMNIVERNKQNSKNAGRPKKEIQNNPMDLSGNPNNPNYNYNYNSSNNSSKEELLDKQQPSSLEGDEVVSKGLESLENIFPQGRNFIGIDEVNLWNSLTQQNKQVMIKRASMYIRNEKKKDDGKYIKGIGKWMREQVEKGFEESLPSIKNGTKSDDPRLLKHTDGGIYSILLEKTNNSTGTADKLYHILNKKDDFTNRESLLNFVKGLDRDEINTLIN